VSSLVFTKTRQTDTAPITSHRIEIAVDMAFEQHSAAQKADGVSFDMSKGEHDILNCWFPMKAESHSRIRPSTNRLFTFYSADAKCLTPLGGQLYYTYYLMMLN
jgi:hypothetical protein